MRVDTLIQIKELEDQDKATERLEGKNKLFLKELNYFICQL